jgi:thiamine-phosphate pyrophosphorylase
MEIPSVLSDPQATPEAVSSEGCEFLALGESLWRAPEGAPAAIAAIARRLEQE